MTEAFSKTQYWSRWLLAISLVVLGFLAGLDFYDVAGDVGHGAFLGHFDKIWGAIFVAFFLFSVVFLGGIVVQLFYPEKTTKILQPLLKFRHNIRWLKWPFALLFVGWLAYLLCYSTYSFDFSSFTIRLYFFVVSVVLSGIILTDGSKKILTWVGLLQGIVFFGVFFLVAKKLISITNFPLSLSWSEGNRLWDYAVFFGRDLYIYPVDQPLKAYIDRGRQSLWGLPFLFSNVTIAQVRLWSVIVGMIPYALLGWIVFRTPKGNRRLWVFMGLWVLIFLQQGPIYSPLVLAAILVAIARQKPLWLGLPLVVIAGYYAQMSRFTWMFAPAMWAVMIAFHDHPPESLRRNIKNWGYIFVYGLAGLIGGVGISGWKNLAKNFIPTPSSITISPNLSEPTASVTEVSEAASNTGIAAAITDQPLLWSRLFPGSIYPEGIILGLLIAVGPLILFLLYLVISKRWKLNRWQKVGILLPVILFLIVGLIISVKIGGGDNLHNLDMFLISLIFVTALAWEGAGEGVVRNLSQEPLWLQISIMLAAAIPAFYPVMDAEPLKLPPRENVELTLEYIQKESDLTVSQGQEILFMDQRQLLTFGFVENVPLVADYEKKLVMDKAMSRDANYFNDFYQDLANHRFGLIISEPQVVLYASDDDAWAEENDVWIEWVTKPLLCYYEPQHDFKKTAVWLFVPRIEPLDCKYP